MSSGSYTSRVSRPGLKSRLDGLAEHGSKLKSHLGPLRARPQGAWHASTSPPIYRTTCQRFNLLRPQPLQKDKEWLSLSSTPTPTGHPHLRDREEHPPLRPWGLWMEHHPSGHLHRQDNSLNRGNVRHGSTPPPPPAPAQLDSMNMQINMSDTGMGHKAQADPLRQARAWRPSTRPYEIKVDAFTVWRTSR